MSGVGDPCASHQPGLHQGPGYSIRHQVWAPHGMKKPSLGQSCSPGHSDLYPADFFPLQLASPNPRYQGSVTNVSVLSSSQASPSSSSLSSTHSAPSQMIASAPSSARGKGGRCRLQKGKGLVTPLSSSRLWLLRACAPVLPALRAQVSSSRCSLTGVRPTLSCPQVASSHLSTQ